MDRQSHILRCMTTSKKRAPRRPKFSKDRPISQESVQADLRLFIAVPLPEPVRDLLRTVVDDLREEPWPIRWVSPDNAHLTLNFIGEVSPERAELLRLALPPVIARHERFRLRTADLGVFPNQKRPRVLWLGLYGPAHRLVTLRSDIASMLRSMEFTDDKSELHPHITLGRLRDVRNMPTRDLPAQIAERFRAETESGRVSARNTVPFPIDDVVLYRSMLGRDGPTYVELARCPLGIPPKVTKTASDPV